MSMLVLDNEPSAVGVTRPRPFFGVPPRALAPQITRLAEPGQWFAVAAALEYSDLAADVPDLDDWRARTAACDVASWGSVRAACERYLNRLLSEPTFCDAASDWLRAKVHRDTAWLASQVKEGCTTSVWKVWPAADPPIRALCINISRDAVASLEFLETIEHLRRWFETDHSHVAEVFSFDIVEVRDGTRSFGLAASVGPWVDGREVHIDAGTNGLQGIAIDTFVGASPDGRPRLLGERFSEPGLLQVISDWREFLIRHARARPCANLAFVPDVDFNDGDLILTRSEIVVVACGAKELIMPADRYVERIQSLDPARNNMRAEAAAAGVA